MDSEDGLRELLNDPSTLQALGDIYERTLGRILRELASGISRPGAARARDLVAKIRELIYDIDPSRDSSIRAWIRENVPKAFVLGDNEATEQLRKDLEAAADDERAAFGQIRDGWNAVNQTGMKAIVSLMEETLKNAAADILNTVVLAVRRTQLVLHTDAGIRESVVSGIIRGAGYRELSDDIANLILEGKLGTDAIARLRAAGFQPDLLALYQRLSNGDLIQVGGRNYNVRAYANLVARTMLAEATNTAAVVRLQQNGVDHVQISWHLQKEPDICTLYAGRVFYIGPGEDPLGFPKYSEIPKCPFHPNCRHRLMAYVAALKPLSDVEAAKADADLIPGDFFAQEARAIEKKLGELTPAQWKAIQPRVTKLLPAEFFTEAPLPPAAAA